MKKYGNATKSEWLKWIKSELTPPVKVKNETKEVLIAFRVLLTNKKEVELVNKVYEQALCWTEDKRAEMLKPEWVKLKNVERYVYEAYIQAYDNKAQMRS